MTAGIPASVGRYRIQGEIGRGAMGAVYRAEDPKLGRAVAVKMISAAVASGLDRDEIAARFEREARVAARLQHPNVVAVHDVGSEGDSLYLVMELIEGDSLAQRLSRGDFPNAADALSIAAQAADALVAAHESGVIHRDIKPANLLFARDGRVKVGDFGVAKAIGERTDLTRTGMMVGSPAYMAPEQVKGMSLDGRSDLFSLGVVLFEMLLRRKPFPADTVTTLVYQILHEDPLEDVAMTSALGPELAEFLRWTLAKDRETRIPDARTFALRARALAAGAWRAPAETAPTEMLPARPAAVVLAPATPASAPWTPPPQPVASMPAAAAPSRRSPLLVGAGFGAVVVLAVVATAWLTRSPEAPEVGGESPTPLAAAPLAQPEPPKAPARSEPELAPPVEAREPEPERPAPTPIAPAAVEPAPPASVPAPDQPSPSLVAAAAEATAPAVDPVPDPIEPPAPAPAPAIPISAVFETQRAAEFHVSPEEAMVEVEGLRLGIADDWDGMGGGKEYVFPGPGQYVVKLSLEGYRTAWIKVVVRPGAEEDVADVDTELLEIEE